MCFLHPALPSAAACISRRLTHIISRRLHAHSGLPLFKNEPKQQEFGLKTVDYCENMASCAICQLHKRQLHYAKILSMFLNSNIQSVYRLDVCGGMVSWWRMGQRVLICLVFLFLLICRENITYHTSVQTSNMGSRKCGVKPSQRNNRIIQLESQLEMAVQNLEDLCIFMVITLKIFSTQWQIIGSRVTDFTPVLFYVNNTGLCVVYIRVLYKWKYVNRIYIKSKESRNTRKYRHLRDKSQNKMNAAWRMSLQWKEKEDQRPVS